MPTEISPTKRGPLPLGVGAIIEVEAEERDESRDDSEYSGEAGAFREIGDPCADPCRVRAGDCDRDCPSRESDDSSSPDHRPCKCGARHSQPRAIPALGARGHRRRVGRGFGFSPVYILPVSRSARHVSAHRPDLDDRNRGCAAVESTPARLQARTLFRRRCLNRRELVVADDGGGELLCSHPGESCLPDCLECNARREHGECQFAMSSWSNCSRPARFAGELFFCYTDAL